MDEQWKVFETKKRNPLVTVLLLCAVVILASIAIGVVYTVSSTIYYVENYEPRYEKELQTSATLKIEYVSYLADNGKDGDVIDFLVKIDINRDDTYDFECDESSRWDDTYADKTVSLNNVCSKSITVDEADQDGSGRGITVEVDALYSGFWSDTCYDLWREEGGCGVWGNPLKISWNKPYSSCEYEGELLKGTMTKTLVPNGYNDGDSEDYNMKMNFKVMIDYSYKCKQVA